MSCPLKFDVTSRWASILWKSSFNFFTRDAVSRVRSSDPGCPQASVRQKHERQLKDVKSIETLSGVQKCQALCLVYFSCNQVSFLWPWLDNSRISLSKRVKKMTVLVISPFLILTLIRYCHDKVKACYLLESQGARYQPRLQPWSPLASWVVPSLQKEWSQQCLKSATFLECRQLPAVALTCICRSLRPQFSPIYTHRYTGIPIYPGPIGLFRRTTIQIGYRLLQSLQQRHFAWSGELLQYSLPK